jgi:hypothetical protein
VGDFDAGPLSRKWHGTSRKARRNLCQESRVKAIKTTPVHLPIHYPAQQVIIIISINDKEYSVKGCNAV